MEQLGLFGNRRLQMNEAIDMTIASLQTYGPRFDHWAIAWSVGKDSTLLLTLVIWLIETGRISRPKTLTVLRADTRLELLPLAAAASQIEDELDDRGIEHRTVLAEMEKRFLVYLLGRGVPPPNNGTLRWCTRQIKVEPMVHELRQLFGERGQQVLMLTGVRQGESAIRDGRIAMSCSRDGAECGQGWYQEALPNQLCSTLAPILHWRVCHVWEWLKHWAPRAEYGDWSTSMIADAYGGDEAEELNARTGCTGCPLVTGDSALERVVRIPKWAYMEPLKELRELWRELRKSKHRLRKHGGETRADGSLVKNQQRMGPLTIAARRMALAKVLEIQERVNAGADRLRMPRVDLLNDEEVAAIRAMHDARVFPKKWSGFEPRADAEFDLLLSNGVMQPLLLRALGQETVGGPA